MKKTVYKVFTAFHYEKEEKWLNEMSARGLQLTDVGLFRYTFAEGTPGAYQYKLELLNNWPTHPESERYIRFLEETGVEHVASFTRWVYLRKKTSDGAFELFSDIDSQIRHYKRLTALFGIVGIGEFFISAGNFVSYADRPYGGNLIGALLTLCCGVLLAYGYFHVRGKIRALRKERVLRE